MNYTQKYFEEIFEAMLNDSLNKGLISHAEDFPAYIANEQDISNYYVLDKAVIAEMFAKVYEDITNVYNNINITLATGKDLDNIGDIVGIIRPAATYSMVSLAFSLNAVSQEDIIISPDVIVETLNGIQYRTVEEIYLPSGKTSTLVQATAVLPGISSKVIENTITRIVSDLSVSLQVTNPSASTGGHEEYTDDEYRELLLVWPLIHLKGSEEAYENYFANFDGLNSFKLVPNWNGTGTMKVILDPGTPYLMNKAYNELQSSVTQATEDINIFAPVEKPINVTALVNTDIDMINPYSDNEKSVIQSKIIQGIKTFINGGFCNDGTWYNGLGIGEDFIPHKLAVFLDKEIFELKNISFQYPEDYIEILDDEQGKADKIIVEMI